MDGDTNSQADGDEDCQPMNFEFCLFDQVRTASGQCINIDCSSPTQCSSGSGSWNADLGTCVCRGLPSADDICGPSCRAASVTLKLDPATKSLVVADPSTGNSTQLSLAEDLPGYFGTLTCTEAEERVAAAAGTLPTVNATRTISSEFSCGVFAVSMSDSGFEGLFGADDAIRTATPGAARRMRRVLAGSLQPLRRRIDSAFRAGSDKSLADATSEARSVLSAALQAALLDSTPPHVVEHMVQHTLAALSAAPRTMRGPSRHGWWAAPSSGGWGARGHGRHLQVAVSDQTARMQNPTSCLAVGESMLFSIGTTDPGARNYPVYLKDSFVNSNADFDYGAFRDLAELLADPATSAGISHFGYTFEDPGVYVFGSSLDPTQQMLVRVVAVGQSCPASLSGSVFNPATQENVVNLGMGQAVEPQLVPDWRLLAALVVGVFLASALFMGCVYYWRVQSWDEGGTAGLLSEDYQRTREKQNKTKGVTFGGRGPCDAMCCVLSCGAARCQSRGTSDGRKWNLCYCCGRRQTWLTPDAGKAFKEDAAGRSSSARAGGSGGGDADSDAGSNDYGSLAALGGDRGEWNPDSMDLQALLGLMREHDAHLAAGFKGSHDALARAQKGIREEAESLRRLIAQSAVDARAEGVVGGSAAQASQRAAVLRQLEGELAAHAMWDKQLARREAAVQSAVRALGDAISGEPLDIAHSMVDALAALSPDLEDNQENIAMAKRLRPADSEPAERVRRLLAHAVDVIRRYNSAVAGERARRTQAIGVLRAATNANVTATFPQVAAALQSYEATMLPLDSALDRHLGMLMQFANGGDEYSDEQTGQLASFLKEFVEATRVQNPAQALRARTERGDKMTDVVAQLQVAVQALLARFPASSASMQIARMRATAAAGDALQPIQAAKESDVALAKKGGVSRQAMAQLRRRLQQLISAVEDGMCDANVVLVALGLLPESALKQKGGSLEDAKAAAAATALLAREEEGIAGERKTLEEALEAAAARDNEELDAEDERGAEEALARELEVNPEMTEQEREAVVAAYKQERLALRDTLLRERQRQRDLMGESLDARKAERVARRLKRAEAKATAAATDAEGDARDAMEKRQARDRQAAAAEAEAELQEEMASARAAAGVGRDPLGSADMPFDAERLLAALKDAHEADVESMRSAQGSEQERQAAMLSQRLAARRAERLERSRKAKQTAIESAGGDYNKRAALLAAAAVETRGTFSNLAQAEDEDVEQAVLHARELAGTHEGELAANRERFDVELARLQGRVGAEMAERKAEARRAIEEKFVRRRKQLEAQHAVAMDACSSLPERRALAAKHAANMSKLAAEQDAEVAATDAKIESAAAAAMAELEAASAAAQLAAVRGRFDAETEAAKAQAALRKAATDEKMASRIGGWRQGEELDLLSQQASEIAEVANDPELRARLQEKHAEEWTALQRRLGREEAEMRQQADEEFKGHEADLDAQMAALRAGYEREAGSLRETLVAERSRQAAAAKERRAQRAARRTEALRQRQAAEAAAAERESTDAAAAVAEAHAAEAAASEASAAATAAAAEKAAEAEAELVASTFEADAQVRRLYEQRAAEASSRRAALDDDKRKQESSLGKKLEERRARRLAKLAAAQAEESAAAATEQDVAVVEAVAAQHAAELAEVEEEIAAEADSERKALAAQMRAKYEANKAREAEASLLLEDRMAEIRQEASSNANSLLRSLQGEKSRQLSTMEAQMRARKQRKLRKMRLQQETDLAAAAEETAKQSADAHLAAILADDDDAEDFEAAVLAAIAALTGGAELVQQAQSAQAAARGQPAGPADAATLADQSAVDAALAEERASLEEQHAQEQADAEAEAEEEATAAEAQLEADAERRRQAELAAARAELEARLAAVNENNQEEFERVRAQAEKDLARVEARLDDQKRAQKSDLSKRLAKRRARKRQTAQRQRARDLDELDRKRTTALQDLTNKATTASEIEALREILTRGDGLVTRESAGAAVEAVMKKRHDKEQNELLQLQLQERSRGLKDALGDMVDSKGEAREEVLAQLQSAGASPEEVAEHIQEFEASFTQQLAEVERSILRELEAKHATEKLQLREQQLRETAAFLEELAPDDVQRRQEAASALEEANELLEFQDGIQREREQREAKAEADRASYQQRLEAESAAELAAQEEAMQAALEEARAAAEERMAAERAKMKQESSALRAKLLEGANRMTDGERERLLQELETGLAAKEEKLQQRKRAQENKLKAQLAKRHAKARRKREAENAARLSAEKSKSDAAEAARRSTEAAKRKAAQAAAVAKGSGGGTSGKVMNAVTELSAKQASARSQPAEVSRATAAKLARLPSARGASFVAPVAANAPTLKASDSPQYSTIVSRLDGIESMMTQLRARAAAAAPGSALAAATAGQAGPAAATADAVKAAWMDVTSPAPEGTLKVLASSKLSAREALRIMVGRRLLQAAGLATLPAGVRIAAAETLPNNNYLHNAYRNVYWYDVAAGTLYFRRERLWSTGDFVVCLAHAVAHVRSNPHNLGNDSDAKFQEEFHRLLRLMGQQLASASTQMTPLAPPGGEGDSDGEETQGAATGGGLVQSSVSEMLHDLTHREEGRDPLQRSPSALHKLQAAVHRVTAARNLGISDNAMQNGDLDDDEDDDAPPSSPQSSQWATGSLSYRVAQVGKLGKHAELQRFLHGLEEAVMAAEAGNGEEEEAEGDTSLTAGSHRHRRTSTVMPEDALLADLPAASAEADAATYKRVMADRVAAWEKKVDDANGSYMKYQMRMQHFGSVAQQKAASLEAARKELQALQEATQAQAQVAELQSNGKSVPAELLEEADTSLYASEEALQQRISLLEGEAQVAAHNRSKAAEAAETWNDRLQRWSKNLHGDQARVQRSSRQSVFEQSAELKQLREEMMKRTEAAGLENVPE